VAISARPSRQLVRDERGQDLVEYGMLTAFIAIAAMLAYTTIPDKMGNAFSGAGTEIHNLWIPQDPATTP
jgi:Flp pilus assembly pilin Flp